MCFHQSQHDLRPYINHPASTSARPYISISRNHNHHLASIHLHTFNTLHFNTTMAGGKGKSIGGKATGAKDSASKSQKSHSAKAGLQVRRTKSHMLALSRSTSDVSLRQHFRPFRAQKTKMTRFFQLNQIAPLQGVMPGILLESHNALANVVAVTK